MSDPGLEEDGLISQDDIDKILDSSSIEDAEEPLPNNDADGDDEFGELSQDDIDALMNSSVSSPEDSIEEDDFEDDDMELISQDDIDGLMDSNDASDEDVDEGVELISQDDVNKLMGGGATEDISRDDDDYVIDESEAVDAQDSLIAQKTIDDLIQNFDTDVPSEPVILDEEPEFGAQIQPTSDPGPVAESDELNVAKDPDLDDIDEFLMSDSDSNATAFDFDGDDDDGNDFQDDIDAFLLDGDDEEEEKGEEKEDEDSYDEDDILISQEDIDTLLMVADQEDEDVLGDLMDNDFGSSLEDQIDEEEAPEPDSLDADDEGQVVLEEDDDEQAVKLKEKTRSKWYKPKLAIACISVLLVLGITVPLTYFFFFTGEPGESVHPGNAGKVAVETHREIEIETVDIHVKKQGDIKKPGNMILKDFVILAPDPSKDMTYITADISIDYSDQSAYFEIQNNLSFYRDLIYDSLNQSLVTEKREEITEAGILWIVETALKKALPGPYIDRVSFTSFTAS